MGKVSFVLGLVAVMFIVESTCEFRIIRPTYRPPPRPRQPIIRTARASGNERLPQWLNQGDDVIKAPSTGEHPFLPSIIDDVKLDPNTRYTRSLSAGQGTDRNDAGSELINTLEYLEDQDRSRYPRSLSTPGRGRVGSNDRRGSGGSRGHDTGATHPGYNRRNARSVGLPDFVTTPPFNPKPWPGFPKPERRPRFPIYV